MFLDISATVLAILIALIVILFGVLIWLRKSAFEIQCRDPLFRSEFRSFLGQLDIAVRSHLSVFPSMPVTDVLTAKRFSRGNLALNRISGQRFDYVLCHRREMEVLCVIKLLPYGKKADTRELNSLREACEVAGLTLLEYEMKPYRDVQELRKVVFSACGIDDLEAQEHGLTEAETGQEPAEEKTLKIDSPQCPKCSSPMQLKTITKGSKAGQKCWVCTNYPECKGAKLLTAESS